MVRWRKSAEQTAEPSSPGSTPTTAQATAPATAPAAPATTEAPAETPAATSAPEKPAEKPVQKKEAPVAKSTEEQKPSKGKQAGQAVVAGTNLVRSRIASLVWLVAVVCALILAIAALLVALGANKDNAIVSFVLGAADTLDLGVFSRTQGIFTFHGADAATKNALVNWGIAAVAYLVVGKLLDRVIRP